MKSIILSTILGCAVLLTGGVAAQADTITVHGYQGTSYGR